MGYRIFPSLVRSISRANPIPFARKEVLALEPKRVTPPRDSQHFVRKQVDQALSRYGPQARFGRSESTDISDLLVVEILKLYEVTGLDCK